MKTPACLRFHAAFASLVNKKKRVNQYKKLRKHFCSTTPNCGLLVTNHVLGICSTLSLLPAWVQGEIEVSPSTWYMQWFSSKFGLSTSSDTMEEITETVRHALTSRYGTPFSRRKVENILCKVYRTRTGSNSDKKFCDIVSLGKCYPHRKVPNYVYPFPPSQNLRTFWWTTTLYGDGRMKTLCFRSMR